MAFVYGTISDASPGSVLYTAIADGLADEGFVLVDTVVISTRTHKVWKCPAANNSHNLDWYLDVVYSTTGSGSMWFAPFEDFDPATDLGYRGIFANTGSHPVDATTFSRYGSTGYALETNWATTSTGLAFATNTTSFGYWISITPDRIAALSSVAASDVVYSGFYNPHPLHVAAVGTSAVYPLVNTKLHSSGDTVGANPTESALTRVPGLTGTTTNAYYHALYVRSVSTASFFYMPGLPSESTAGFSIRGATPVILMASTNYTGPATIWGTLHDVATVRATNTVVRGDTTTIAGSPWILTTAASSSGTYYSILFKA